VASISEYHNRQCFPLLFECPRVRQSLTFMPCSWATGRTIVVPVVVSEIRAVAIVAALVFSALIVGVRLLLDVGAGLGARTVGASAAVLANGHSSVGLLNPDAHVSTVCVARVGLARGPRFGNAAAERDEFSAVCGCGPAEVCDSSSEVPQLSPSAHMIGCVTCW